MTEDGLVVRGKSRRKYNSYQGEISPSVPNALNRDFHAEKPNEKWLTDITEFAIPAGKVYLSPIVDCFDGMLPYWTVSTTPDAALVNDMLDGAISQLGVAEHPVVHSDRGCHYRRSGCLASSRKCPPPSPEFCFIVAKFQKGLPDISESPIKSSFLLITQ